MDRILEPDEIVQDGDYYITNKDFKEKLRGWNGSAVKGLIAMPGPNNSIVVAIVRPYDIQEKLLQGLAKIRRELWSEY